MKRLSPLLLVLSLITGLAALGQPYQTEIFPYSVETDIEYGLATDFAGNTDTLLMDIYKPIGDNNCFRPCMILVHGGAWLAGSKNDVNIEAIAESFAQRGWVVAAINYRLGMHKTPNYTMYALCNEQISVPCGYIADSAEVFRAIYRGQQDTKGAVRFMKERSSLDSTDLGNFFLTGESAGGFNAFAATFMNDISEKPQFCEAIAAAPTPDADLISCLPNSYNLDRPDLGNIDGDLNLGTHDATVEGIASIYGGALDLDMFANENEWPAIYMYHQGSDVIVNHDYGRLLGRIDWECFAQTNICQTYTRYPKAYGSTGLNTYFDQAIPGGSTPRMFSFIDNYEYLNDCFDNGHSVVNLPEKMNEIAFLFGQQLIINGNSSSPCFAGLVDLTDNFTVNLHPNPSSGIVHVQSSESTELFVYTPDGRMIYLEENKTTQHTVELTTRAYLLILKNDSGATTVERVIVQ